MSICPNCKRVVSGGIEIVDKNGIRHWFHHDCLFDIYFDYGGLTSNSSGSIAITKSLAEKFRKVGVEIDFMSLPKH